MYAFTCPNEPRSSGEENTPTIVPTSSCGTAGGVSAGRIQPVPPDRAGDHAASVHAERYDPQIGRMTDENTNATMQQCMIGPNLLELLRVLTTSPNHKTAQDSHGRIVDEPDEPDSNMAPAEISVADSSTIYRPPERAILRVEAKSEGLYQDESLRSECRKSALQDAIYIAGEYAEVIGREALTDVHVVQVKGSSHLVDYVACRFSASWGDEHHRLDPTPQDIPSRHHVDVTFRGEWFYCLFD